MLDAPVEKLKEAKGVPHARAAATEARRGGRSGFATWSDGAKNLFCNSSLDGAP